MPCIQESVALFLGLLAARKACTEESASFGTFMQWQLPHSWTVMVPFESSPATLNDKRCMDLLGDSASIPLMRHFIFSMSILSSLDALVHDEANMR